MQPYFSETTSFFFWLDIFACITNLQGCIMWPRNHLFPLIFIILFSFFFYYSYIIVFIFGLHSIYMQAYMRNNLIWPQPNREKRIPITVHIFEEAEKQHDRDSLEEDLPSQIELHYRYYVHICVVCT